VNPFCVDAIGAIYPDGQKNSISVNDIDRITLKLSSWIQEVKNNLNKDIDGMVIAFLPRCNAAGWMTGTFGASSSTINPFVNRVTLQSDFTTLITATDRVGSVDAYALCFALLGQDGKFYARGNGIGVSWIEGFNYIELSRWNAIYQSCEALRVLGVGIKLWPTAPQLTTGGKCFGGCMSNEDFYKIFAGTSQFSATNIESALNQTHIESGPDGLTIRYASTQSPVQLKMADILVQGVIKEFDSGGTEGYQINQGIDLSSQDLCETGDDIPVAVWRFESATVNYDLSLFVNLIGQAKLSAFNPYRSALVVHDPKAPYLRSILNHNKFPIAVEGHSFKSFIHHASKLISKGMKFAPHIMKLLKLIEENMAA
jgi:hypothetical protein